VNLTDLFFAVVILSVGIASLRRYRQWKRRRYIAARLTAFRTMGDNE